jgi:hypothetical protein
MFPVSRTSIWSASSRALSRGTELLMRNRSAALVGLCLTAAVVSACGRTSDGVPIADEAASSVLPSATSPSTRAIPTAESDLTEPGVVPTTRRSVPAGTMTCESTDPPPDGAATATVADPAAPKITVALPAGWSTGQGDGDVGAKLTGPEGIWATVTIAKTTLDPATAFKQYADEAMGASAVSSVSVLPADLCGYSGQKLLGSCSDAPEQGVDFGDRIAHVWTNAGNYLVTVHVQGPASNADFDPFTSPLMNDFGIEIP